MPRRAPTLIPSRVTIKLVDAESQPRGWKAKRLSPRVWQWRPLWTSFHRQVGREI